MQRDWGTGFMNQSSADARPFSRLASCSGVGFCALDAMVASRKQKVAEELALQEETRTLPIFNDLEVRLQNMYQLRKM